MFKLYNDYPLATLLRRVWWNARAMFLAYALVIGTGAACAALVLLDRYRLWMLLPPFLGICLLPVVPLLLWDYFHAKRGRYSLFTAVRGEPGALDVWDGRIRASDKIGDRLGISGEYLFSMKSTFYIPYALPVGDIDTVYFRRYRRRGRDRLAAELYVKTRDGARLRLPIGYRALLEHGGALDEFVFAKLLERAPRIRTGYLHGRHRVKW